MKANLKWWLFAAMVALQLAVPGTLIVMREWALHHGHTLLLAVGPVDPVDLVRGRYVALDYLNTSLSLPHRAGWKEGDRAYLTFHYDKALDLHLPTNLSPTKPEGLFLEVKVSSVESASPDATNRMVARRRGRRGAVTNLGPTPGNDTVGFRIPLDRYYMEEDKAPEMERSVRAAAFSTDAPAKAVIRVWRGTAVLEKVLVPKG